MQRARMLAALALCERELDRFNALPTGAMALGLDRLGSLLRQGRLPRIAAIGRRGSGKSSLLNAIAGRGIAALGDVEDATRRLLFWNMPWRDRTVEWVDTPGLRAGGRPGRRDEVTAALSLAPPDVLLVLCQASEVDAGIDDDLADVAFVRARLARDREGPTVFGVVTKVDELAPADVSTPPFDDPDKLANIRRAVGLFTSHLRRAGIQAAGVLPVVTYARFDRTGCALEDLRWNVSTLVERVSQALPGEAQVHGPLAREALVQLLSEVARDVTEAFAERAARVARGQTGVAPAFHEREVQSLGALHAQLLAMLSPFDGPVSAGWRASLSAPDGVLDSLRAGLAELGGQRLSAALAASRIRNVGRAWTLEISRRMDERTVGSILPR